MRKYDEVQELLKELRDMAKIDGCRASLAAADEIEALTAIMAKQQEIIRRVYVDHFPNTWFPTSGYGEKDSNGLPQFIEVVPAYGVGWSQVYEKTARIIQYEGS
jgi:hypothetical protein